MISNASLLPFGKAADDGIEITESFSLACDRDNFAACAIFSALSSYEGENAPKISFALTVNGEEKPFYRSHTYRIGKKNAAQCKN